MNASATIRAEYVRNSRMNFKSVRVGSLTPIRDLEARPIRDEKLRDFNPVNHIQHREDCDKEREARIQCFDVISNSDKGQEIIDNRYLENASFMEFDDDSDHETFRKRFRKVYTVFPYRDPIYLVTIIFAAGSLDLVINAFFDLLPRILPDTEFETEETVAVPTTVLIGSIFFFVAGIFDVFGALNADCGTLENSKEDQYVKYRPALIGSAEFKWIPGRAKFFNLLMTNSAFQAGLIVLVGGIVFIFAGIVDFPGIISEESPSFGFVVFGPQVVHGALFFVANVMLAVSEQDKWWRPKLICPGWQGAFLNAVGGLAFMFAGFFLSQDAEVAAGAAAMLGSWAFLVGSLVRWYAVLEIF